MWVALKIFGKSPWESSLNIWKLDWGSFHPSPTVICTKKKKKKAGAICGPKDGEWGRML